MAEDPAFPAASYAFAWSW